MADYLKHIQDISPCVTMAERAVPLRDYLFALDGLAHAAHDTSGDGILTEAE